MHVTDDLAKLVHRIAVASVESDVARQKNQIRAALDGLNDEIDEFIRRDASAELVCEYRRISAADYIHRESRSRSHDLTYRLFAAKVDLPVPPEPPVRKDIWDLVVVKNDRKNFDEHMEILRRTSLYVLQTVDPKMEFVSSENLKDPHWLGLWSLDRERYPDACDWDATLANIKADIERCKRDRDGYPERLKAYVAECLNRRISACAETLGITKEDFAARMPEDLVEYWSSHASE